MVSTVARTRGSLVTRLGGMPAEDPDVAFVLQAFQAFEVQEGTLEEYFERFWVPEGVIEFVDGFPIRGSYRGVEGYKQWFADSYGPYEDVQRRLDSITKEGDRVVALLTVTGRPQDADIGLEVQLGHTYELAKGGLNHCPGTSGPDGGTKPPANAAYGIGAAAGFDSFQPRQSGSR